MNLANVDYEAVTKIYLYKIGEVSWKEYIEERDRVCARAALNGLVIKEILLVEDGFYIIKIYGAIETDLIEHVLGAAYDVAVVSAGYTKETLPENLRSDIYECLDQKQNLEN